MSLVVMRVPSKSSDSSPYARHDPTLPKEVTKKDGTIRKIWKDEPKRHWSVYLMRLFSFPFHASLHPHSFTHIHLGSWPILFVSLEGS